jgi:hypothetical protein
VLLVFCICLPSQLKFRGSLPACFNELTNARVVVDATEITVDVPQDMSLLLQLQKSRYTVKSVIGIAPNGTIVFCRTWVTTQFLHRMLLYMLYLRYIASG